MSLQISTSLFTGHVQNIISANVLLADSKHGDVEIAEEVSNSDMEPVVGNKEVIEESFVDVFCDRVYGGGVDGSGKKRGT
jgi:hypothetical protein